MVSRVQGGRNNMVEVVVEQRCLVHGNWEVSRVTAPERNVARDEGPVTDIKVTAPWSTPRRRLH